MLKKCGLEIHSKVSKKSLNTIKVKGINHLKAAILIFLVILHQQFL